ncbi:MAG: LamG domain-containing protein [Melioribacteraceae bacterium]|nr:LamG domain-containing protein [Melioribacteraceae bacterium]
MSDYIYDNLLNRPITGNTKIFLPFDSTESKFTNYGTELNLQITDNLTSISSEYYDIGEGSLSIQNNGWVKIENHNINLETQEYWTIQLSFLITSHKRQTVFAKVYEMEEGGYDSSIQFDLLPDGRGVFYYSYANYNSFDTLDIGALELNKIYKIALVRNGQSLKFFINGICVLQSCGIRDYGDGIPVNNFNGLYDITSAPFYIGSHPECDVDDTDGSSTFDGYIDNFRIDYEALWDSDYGIEYSPIGGVVNIVSKNSSVVGASLYVTQHGYSSIGSSIYINPKSDINSTVNIIRMIHGSVYIIPRSEIGCSVNVTSENQNIYASVMIGGKLLSNIQSKVIVAITQQKLGAAVVVSKFRVSSISASVFLVGGLSASVNVIKKSSQDIGASLFVCQKGLELINACIFIAKDVDINAIIKVSRYNYKNISAIVNTIADRPDSVIITSNIEENVWQNNDSANFEWQVPHDNMSIVDEYHIAFNTNPYYNVTELDQRLNDNYVTKTADYSGRWYLHVRAVNRIGNYSKETSHYCIAFNNLPSNITPSGMLINGEYSYNGPIAFPEFQWNRSLDIDQLDYVNYELQISEDEFITNFIDDIVDIPLGNEVIYNIQNTISVGHYKWRVRPYDGKQYGDWTESQYPFDIVSEKIDVGAKVLIPIYSNKNIGAKIYIINYSNLNASVYVRKRDYSDINCQLRVCKKGDFEIGAVINIRSYLELKAKVNINYGIELKCRVTIINVEGNNNISSVVRVCHKYDSELNCSVTVKYKEISSIGAGLYIIPYSNIGCSLNVYDITNFGYIDDFSNNIGASVIISKKSSINIYGRVSTIASRPDMLSVFCNVNGETWQENNLITFTWNSLENQEVEIDGYFTQLDKNPTTQPSENFQRSVDFIRNFDLEILSGAGIYYFHAVAKNIYGNYGPVNHFEIKYNHKPSIPINLYINNSYSERLPVLVSRYGNNTFEWEQSIDIDQLDSLLYDLQIATRSDFGKDLNGNESIILNSVNILQNYYIISISYLSKDYYWRVRSFDGHEYSNWSSVGMFKVNTPPTIPNKLYVN